MVSGVEPSAAPFVERTTRLIEHTFYHFEHTLCHVERTPGHLEPAVERSDKQKHIPRLRSSGPPLGMTRQSLRPERQMGPPSGTTNGTSARNDKWDLRPE